MMAANGVGQLTAYLGLDAADYTRGLTAAELKARKFGEAIGNSIKAGAAVAVTGFASATTAAVAFYSFVNSQADKIAGFQDLADKVGDTAEQVATLQTAANLSGTALDTVAAASVKLTSALAKSDDESKGAAAGLKAIGLEAEAFKKLSPVEQIDAVAKALAGYKDGAEKTAVAVALFGKSGADLIPFLNDLAEEGERQVFLTQEQIATADEYSKQLARNKNIVQQLAQVVAAESIPAITSFSNALVETAKSALGLDKSATDLKNSSAIKDFADGAAQALAFIIDAADGVIRVFQGIGKTIGAAGAQAVAVAKGDFSEAVKIGTEWRKDLKDIADAPLFSQRLQAQIAARGVAGAATPGTAPKPRINISGLRTPGPKGAGGSDDPTKKLLDNQNKLLEDSIKREQSVLQSRNKMLDLYNGESLISFQQYFGGRRAAQEEANANEQALLDQQIANLQRYQQTAKKQTEREEAQGKINTLLERKVTLQRDAAQEGVALAFQEAKAYRDLERTMQGVNAQILELQGNSAAAARIRFDTGNEELLNRLRAQGDAAGIKQVETLRQLTIAQADYGEQQSQAADVLARLQLEEGRINTAREFGFQSELDGLTRLGVARQAAVQQMEGLVAAQEAIARASGSDKLVLQAEQARAALERLRAEADPLAQKFNEIFQGSFSDAFGDFISGTKSASDAFRSFTDSVVQQISRMASQKLASGLFDGLFGNSSGGGGFNLGGFFSSLFGGGRAGGGAVSPGKMYEVGEGNAPEIYQRNGRSYLLTGNRGGMITPGGRGSAGGVTINQSFAPGTDRKTIQQAAAEAGMAAQRAMVRGTA